MAHNKHIARQSPFYLTEHRLDDNHKLGFDYRDKVIEKTVSPFMYKDEKRVKILEKINGMVVYLIDSVKHIKKTFVYSVDRNSRNIN